MAPLTMQVRGYRERLDNTTETVVAREERNREAKKVPLSPTLSPTLTTTLTPTLTPTLSPTLTLTLTLPLTRRASGWRS